MVIEDFIPLLETLARNLGVASSKIWEWSMLKVYTQVITDVLFLVITVVFIFGLTRYHKYMKENNLFTESKDVTNGWEVALLIFNIAAGVAIIACMFILLELPSLIINPEWHAMQNILTEIIKLTGGS